MSSFTWLDYSEHERRKMLDVIDLFRKHGLLPNIYFTVAGRAGGIAHRLLGGD